MTVSRTRTLVQTAALVAICSLPLTAHTRVAQNPHLGLKTFSTPSHQGFAEANLLIAPGLAESLCHQGVRSRCSAKERDDESGLDYFKARYYSAKMGRFTSADPDNAGAVAGSPQTWNGYSYVSNSPLRLVDPTGEFDKEAIQQQLEEVLSKTAVEVADFAEGTARGAAASITFGAVGRPKETDSLTNRAGQALGTILVGTVSTEAAIGGGGLAVVTSPSGVGFVLGGGVAIAGATGAVGAAGNLGPLVTTPIQRKSRTQTTSGSPSKSAQRAAKKQKKTTDAKQDRANQNARKARREESGEPAGAHDSNKSERRRNVHEEANTRRHREQNRDDK